MKKVIGCILFWSMVLQPLSAEDGAPVKLGAIFAGSGNAAVYGRSGFEAFRYAVQEVNLQGGLLGRHVEPIEFDNRSTGAGSQLAAEEAVKAGVIGVIGSDWSLFSLSVAKVLQDARIPMITPVSTHPEVTLTGDYIFRACFLDSFQGRVMADFALDHLNAVSAVALTNTSSKYSMGLVHYFMDQFQQRGRILWEGDYAQGITDFGAHLDRVSALDPDVVFIPGYDRESAYAIAQARKRGMKQIFIGGDTWNKRLYKYGGKAIDGSYFSEHWHKGVAKEKSRAFVKRYLEKQGEINSSFVPLTVDAVNLFTAAARRAASIEPSKIRQALAETKAFKGITGTITFDKNGDPIGKMAVILKFDSNNIVYDRTIEPLL